MTDRDEKGMNIWDNWIHKSDSKCNIDNCQNADIACDSYDQVHRDIENLRSFGVKNYRFSISWARILPNGTRHDGNVVNDKGVLHYNDWINILIGIYL